VVSQQNVEILRRAYEEVAERGVVDTVADLFHEDAVMYGLDEWPEGGGPWRGRNAILGQWGRIEEDLAEQEVAVEELEAHDDWVLAKGVWRVRSRHGLPGEFSAWLAARFRGDKVIEARYFVERPEALKAVGLEE
jgi:ketosteroid isomerase-like protein